MEIKLINTGFFKLDGGAMFGVVPKSIWEKTNPADEKNLCTWAMRSLIISSENKLTLVDNGIGDKQNKNFLRHYYLHDSNSMENALSGIGVTVEDVTDMFLTHLHFDHCGGSIKRQGDELVTTFKNAKYWSNNKHWKWATEPNAREKASFLKENILPIEASGQLHFTEIGHQLPFDIIYFDGHTEKQMLPKIKYKGRTLVFVADLIPSVGHIPIPYVMGYDTRPLLTMDEKYLFLNEAADQGFILVFQHDPVNECCTVKHTEKGVRLDNVFRFDEI